MDKYGLIGYPLGHSFSVTYFNEKFQSENIDAEYVNFEIPSIEDFPEVVTENVNLCGLNVTIPYKEQVIPYLDELDPDTAKIGAVNVIKIIRQGKAKVRLVGYNSDIIGFTQSISASPSPSSLSCNPTTGRPCCWARAALRRPSTTAWQTWALRASMSRAASGTAKH